MPDVIITFYALRLTYYTYLLLGELDRERERSYSRYADPNPERMYAAPYVGSDSEVEVEAGYC